MYWGFSQFDVEESTCPEPRARPHQHLQGEVMVNDGLAELFQTTPYITCQNHLLEHIHTLTAEAPHQQQYLLKWYCDMEPGSWNSDLQIPLYPLSYSDVATVRQDFSPDITNTPAADELIWNFWKTLAAHQWQVVWECLAIDLQRSIQLINSKKKKRESQSSLIPASCDYFLVCFLFYDSKLIIFALWIFQVVILRFRTM